MRRAPRSVTAGAAIIVGAALVGCAAGTEQPLVITPPEPLTSHAPVATAEPVAAPPLAPPRAVPEPPVPTARYTPVETSAPTRAPASPSPAPSASPTPTPTRAPASIVALLPSASGLAPLSWQDADGARSARWSEIAPAATVARGNALPHVAAARSAGGGCASAADAVDGLAIEGAVLSLAAEPATLGPVDLVLLRYPSASEAAAAVAAVQALGVACEGAPTADGILGSATPLLSAAALLAGDEGALRADVTGEGAMLIAVVHEGAPPEAVAALVAAQLAKLG